MRPTWSCLFIDDDPDIRELVSLNLGAEGVDVHVSATGIGVEHLAASLAPDVVLLDVMMPERDGYAVLAALKASDATREIPVVLLTARATDQEIWQGWQAGADYYLTKPFRIDELIHYLQLIVDERDEPSVADVQALDGAPAR